LGGRVFPVGFWILPPLNILYCGHRFSVFLNSHFGEQNDEMIVVLLFSRASCGVAVVCAGGVMGCRAPSSQARRGKGSGEAGWVGGCVSFLQRVIPGCQSHLTGHPKLLQKRRNFLFFQKLNKKCIC